MEPFSNFVPPFDDMEPISYVEYGKPWRNYNYNQFHVYFFRDRIETTLTHAASIVNHWIREVDCNARPLDRLIVGLDIEWRPSFSVYQNPVAILQLCVGRRCLIFQLLHCDYIPDSLFDFLRNPKYTFVGVGIENDVEKLERDHGLVVENVVDLRRLAAAAYGMRDLRSAGLKKLCEVVLGKVIEKPRNITLGRWDKEELEGDQVQYACVDAYVSYKIGKVLNAAG